MLCTVWDFSFPPRDRPQNLGSDSGVLTIGPLGNSHPGSSLARLPFTNLDSCKGQSDEISDGNRDFCQELGCSVS